MEDKCEYCDEPATQEKTIYDPDMKCNKEVSVCDDCAWAIEDGII